MLVMLTMIMMFWLLAHEKLELDLGDVVAFVLIGLDVLLSFLSHLSRFWRRRSLYRGASPSSRGAASRPGLPGWLWVSSAARQTRTVTTTSSTPSAAATAL